MTILSEEDFRPFIEKKIVAGEKFRKIRRSSSYLFTCELWGDIIFITAVNCAYTVKLLRMLIEENWHQNGQKIL